jgi:hypothetical protein
MTESRAYINEIENEQTIIMNPNILPTQEEWQLVCKIVKQHELTDDEINQIVWQQNLLLGNDDLRKFARAILKKAR